MVFTKVASLFLCTSLLFSPSVGNTVAHHLGIEHSNTTPLATISDKDTYSFTFSTREDRIEQEIGFQIINALSLKPVELRAVVKLKDSELSIGLQNLSNYTKDEFISRWKDALKEAVVIRFEGNGSLMKNNMEKLTHFKRILKQTVKDLKISFGSYKELEDALHQIH